MNFVRFCLVILLSSGFLLSQELFAQGIFSDVNGNVLRVNAYAAVKGSPFYASTDWIEGTINFDGRTSGRTKVKYDLVEDALLYLDTQGNTIQITTPIKEFHLYGLGDSVITFRSGFEAVERNSQSSFYQVLVDGPFTLLKKIRKTIQENVSYGTSVKESYFNEQSQLFLFSPENGITRISNRSSFLNHMGDRRSLLESYAREHKLGYKSEDDLIKLVSFLNSL